MVLIPVLSSMIHITITTAEYVNDKLFKVFTFGSPPIAILDNAPNNNGSTKDQYDCSILSTLGIQNSKVYGYVQPWDPIVRLFSQIDACYPLIGDLGDDGVTLYASGPARTLRPITRAIVEAWQGWPAFRDNFQVRTFIFLVITSTLQIFISTLTQLLFISYFYSSLPCNKTIQV